MPLSINLSDYGVTNANNLATLAGTLNGEALAGAGVASRAMILDSIVNRASGKYGSYGRNSMFSGTSGAAQYASDPNQFSTWRPSEADAYAAATDMRNAILRMVNDPKAFDTYSPAMQDRITKNLTAIRGVMGSGELRGISGESTFYSNPAAIFNPALKAEHERRGLSNGVEAEGNIFYGDNAAHTARSSEAARNFDYAGQIAKLQLNLPPDLKSLYPTPVGRPNDIALGLQRPPLPPGRPDEAALRSYAQQMEQQEAANPLGQLLDGLTGGLKQAGETLASGFGEIVGRLPTPAELQGRLDAVSRGADSVVGQLASLAASPEAKTFAQATGIDPSEYVLGDIYRLGLNRGVDAPSEAAQMEVLRNQGAQSLYNQLVNSQEGRTLALGNFYENNLNRGIDQGGLGKYLADLAAGKSMQAVQTEILSSPEAQALGITPDQFASLITPSYLSSTIGPNGSATPLGPGPTVGTIPPGSTQGTIGPGPTQGTVGGAGTEISPVGPTETRPVGPEGFETSIVGAPEASQTVDDLYETILARDPDTQGAVEYQGQIQRGVPPSIVAAQILNSPEARAIPPEQYQGLVQGYREKYGLLPEDVQTLGPLASEFAQVLRRPADSKTVDWWSQQVDAGTPLSLLEAQLIQAPEVQALGAPALSKLVQDYQDTYTLKPEEVTAIGPLASEFARVLDRSADIETIRAWDGQLDAGATMPELQARLLQAPEVLGRTGGAGDAYTAFQGQYGRSPVDYLAALTDPTKFSGANVSGNVGPGTWDGTFNAAEYRAANPDVAASGMDPLTHFVRFGLSEGRALDTAGHHLNQNFDGNAYLSMNPDVARAGMSPLEHYLLNGAHEGRAAPTGQNPYSFTGINASAGLGPIGNGTFSGTFNGNSYLAANRDVAASGMDPLEHYLRFGFGEGRAVDAQGDRLPQNFDGTAYLAANRDVALAGMDPLRHYLMSGAAEGRAAPTGSNNYSFSNFSVAGGLGNPGTGSFGLGGITSSAPGGMGTMQAPAPQVSNPINPFNFSQINAGTYMAPTMPTDAPTGGFTPNWESASSNALPGSGFGSGSAWFYTDNNGQQQIATFDPKKSENAYLAGQVAQNQQQIEAGRSPFANNPNNWNASFIDQSNAMHAANTFTPTPFMTASPQFGLINPITPTPSILPTPVMAQGLRVNPYGGFGLISAF